MQANVTKRQSILDAAIEEFLERGFEAASMDRITCRAGVSKRTVYNHFESKAVLFGTIIEVMAQDIKPATPVRYDPQAPLRAQLLALGHAKGRFLQSPELMQFVRMGASETLRDPALAEALGERSDKASDYSAFFEEAVAAGAFTGGDARRIEEQFIALIKAQAFWPAMLSGKLIGDKELARLIEETTDTILAAYAR